MSYLAEIKVQFGDANVTVPQVKSALARFNCTSVVKMRNGWLFTATFNTWCDRNQCYRLMKNGTVAGSRVKVNVPMNNNTTVFIGHLPAGTTEDSIALGFSRFDVVDIVLATSFCFVVLRDASQCTAALGEKIKISGVPVRVFPKNDNDNNNNNNNKKKKKKPSSPPKSHKSPNSPDSTGANPFSVPPQTQKWQQQQHQHVPQRQQSPPSSSSPPPPPPPQQQQQQQRNQFPQWQQSPPPPQQQRNQFPQWQQSPPPQQQYQHNQFPQWQQSPPPPQQQQQQHNQFTQQSPQQYQHNQFPQWQQSPQQQQQQQQHNQFTQWQQSPPPPPPQQQQQQQQRNQFPQWQQSPPPQQQYNQFTQQSPQQYQHNQFTQQSPRQQYVPLRQQIYEDGLPKDWSLWICSDGTRCYVNKTTDQRTSVKPPREECPPGWTHVYYENRCAFGYLKIGTSISVMNKSDMTRY